MVKYSAENFDSNAFIVDFSSRNIEFSSRLDAESMFGAYVSVFIVIFAISLMFTLVCSIILAVLGLDGSLIALTILIIPPLGILVSIIIIVWFICDHNAAHEYFPRIMSWGQSTLVKILTLGIINIEKHLIVTPDMIVDKQYCLKNFDNVKLHYKL